MTEYSVMKGSDWEGIFKKSFADKDDWQFISIYREGTRDDGVDWWWCDCDSEGNLKNLAHGRFSSAYAAHKDAIKYGGL